VEAQLQAKGLPRKPSWTAREHTVAGTIRKCIDASTNPLPLHASINRREDSKLSVKGCRCIRVCRRSGPLAPYRVAIRAGTAIDDVDIRVTGHRAVVPERTLDVILACRVSAVSRREVQMPTTSTSSSERQPADGHSTHAALINPTRSLPAERARAWPGAGHHCPVLFRSHVLHRSAARIAEYVSLSGTDAHAFRGKPCGSML